MDSELLDEELQVLLSDKSGEAEFLQALQLQIMTLKVERIRQLFAMVLELQFTVISASP